MRDGSGTGMGQPTDYGHFAEVPPLRHELDALFALLFVMLTVVAAILLIPQKKP